MPILELRFGYTCLPLFIFFCLCQYPRSEEADRGAFGSDGAEPLGGDPEGGLQARP